MGFMERWMSNHWEDARSVLKKPLVMAEFGKSSKDAGFNLNERELFMGNVYRDIYRFARSGGTMSGSLVWQLMAQDMDAYHDGYEIILSQTPSTARIMASQSHAMNALSHLMFTRVDDGAMIISHGHGHGHHHHARLGRKHRRN
ncbi:hypothetical protein ACS0TY_028513 [Phlomoides rotata]